MDFIRRLIKWQVQMRRWRKENAKQNGRPRGSSGHDSIFVDPDLARIHAPDPERIQATWIGHSTFLIQVAGLNILTDPMWSNRASPIAFAGPKRLILPGIRFDDLPHIDIVLVSHTHYDHLDAKTIRRLGNTPRYFVPENLKKWFVGKKISNVSELSWWEVESNGPLTIHAVPAKHWSRRSFPERNSHGWCGWVLDTPLGHVYFVGDTAYDTCFSEIGKKFGPMALSLIPIGAYEPRELMKGSHINPEEAVKIHQDVKSAHSIGMHFATFTLSAEGRDAPPRALREAAQTANVAEKEFHVIKIGETVVL